MVVMRLSVSARLFSLMLLCLPLSVPAVAMPAAAHEAGSDEPRASLSAEGPLLPEVAGQLQPREERAAGPHVIAGQTAVTASATLTQVNRHIWPGRRYIIFKPTGSNGFGFSVKTHCLFTISMLIAVERTFPARE